MVQKSRRFVGFYFVIILVLIRLVFFLFSGGITIPSTVLQFISGTGFGFRILSLIVFPMNASVALAALSATFLEAFIRASSPVVVAV